MSKPIFLTFLAICITWLLHSQEYVYDQYGVKNKFPTDEVYGCLSDEDGFIWIASEAGLYRFNGVEFYHIRPQEGPTFQSVYEVHIDDDQSVWFHGSDGKVRKVCKDGTQQVWSTNGVDPSAFKMAFESDRQGVYWTGSFREGLFKLNSTSKHVESLLPELYVSSVYQHSQGLLLVTSPNVLIYNRQTGDTRVIADFQSNYLTRATISGSRLFVFGVNQGFVIDTSSLQVQDTISLPPDMQIIHTSTDPKGSVILGTWTGMYKLTDQGDIVPHELSAWLGNQPVSYYHEDSSGNQWVTTLTSGIYRFYKPAITKVNQVSLQPIEHVSFIDQKSIFLGGKKGEYATIQNDNLYSHHQRPWKHSGEVLGSVKDSSLNWLITNYDLTLQDDTGTYQIVIPCRDYWYDYRSNELFIVYLAGIFKLTPAIIKELSLYDEKSYKKRSEASDINLFKGNIKAIDVSQNGTKWIVGKYGLASYDGENVTIIDGHDLLSQPLLNVYAVGDILYIASLDEDVIRYDTKNDSVSTIITGQENCNRFIHDIIMDDNNCLWLAHNNGITKIDLTTDKLTCYNQEDGLPITHINSLLSTDSTLLIGTDEGLYRLALSAKTPNQCASISIKDFSVDYSQDKEGPYHIKNRKAYLQLSPLAIGYGENLFYDYTINQQDQVSNTTDPQIPLDRLEYGKNNLSIKLKDQHGQVIAEKQMIIYVSRPIYKEPFLRLVVSLLVFGLLYTGQARIIVEKGKQWMVKKLQKLQPPKLKLTFKLTDGSYTSLLVDDITYLKSAGNYIEVHTIQNRLLTRMTMRKMLDEISEATSLRQVHRSYIVNVEKISSVDHKHVYLGEVAVPYSATYKSAVEPLKSKLKLQVAL